MDELELKSSVAEILEISPADLATDTELESFAAYDSTARLSLMICLSDLSGRQFDLKSLRDLKTYGDILRLLGLGAANG
jgi:acyl carrier protein